MRHALHVADGLLPDPSPGLREQLEDLLAGIHGCWLLHEEYDEPDDENTNADEAEDEYRCPSSPGRYGTPPSPPPWTYTTT